MPACVLSKRERHAELLTLVETSFFNGVDGASRPEREEREGLKRVGGRMKKIKIKK